MNNIESFSVVFDLLFNLTHSCYFGSRLGVVKRCEIVSFLPPDKWPEEVLWPFSPKYPPIMGWPFSLARDMSISLIDALVGTGLSSSNGEARKSIHNNGVMINRIRCTDIARILTSKDRLPKLDAIVLENGKYNFGIVEMC